MFFFLYFLDCAGWENLLKFPYIFSERYRDLISYFITEMVVKTKCVMARGWFQLSREENMRYRLKNSKSKNFWRVSVLGCFFFKTSESPRDIHNRNYHYWCNGINKIHKWWFTENWVGFLIHERRVGGIETIPYRTSTPNHQILTFKPVTEGQDKISWPQPLFIIVFSPCKFAQRN